MFFRVTNSVYCENYTKYINTLYGKNVEFLGAFAELRRAATSSFVMPLRMEQLHSY